jgi:hypothetical protein
VGRPGGCERCRLGRQQFGNADQVVGDQIEHEIGGDLGYAAMFCFAHRAVLFAPAEDAFDHRPARLRQAIAFVPTGKAVLTGRLQCGCRRYFICSSPWCGPPTGHAMLCNDAAPVFRGGSCVRVGQFAKACAGMLTSGGGLHAIGGRRSWHRFADAFRSDGGGMVQLSGSGT